MFPNPQSIFDAETKPNALNARALCIGMLALGLLALPGCATPEPVASDKPQPRERVFFAPYEDVERALKQAMIKYPQRVDNTESGILETDYVRGEARFKPPHKEVEYSNGYRYRLLVHLVRGKAQDKAGVKVVILKDAEIVRDFFSEPEKKGSDGLEEETILYRIQRELSVDRAIHRAQEKANQNATSP